MAESFDVCVIGLGVIGASTTLELARRGVRVIAFDRFDLPHSLGSSGGPNRLIRKAYFEHEDYVPLLHRTYEGWDRISDELGVPLIHRTGLLYLGPEDGPVMSGVCRSRDLYSLDVESVERSDLGRRFPAFRMEPDHIALFEPEAGFVQADHAISGLLRLSHESGAVLSARSEVTKIDREATGAVVVRTSRQTIHARQVVIAAGAWSGGLLDDLHRSAKLDLPLSVTRQVVGFVTPKPEAAPQAFDQGHFPCYAIEERGVEGIYYGMPRIPGSPGMKCARHVLGEVNDPDAVRRMTTAEDEALFRPLFRYVPDANGALLQMDTCLYTMSPDGHFVVGNHPADPRFTVACGFSGHGFKFGPVLGEALADFACDGETTLPVGFLDPARFIQSPPNQPRV